jgi:hypothetical protein
VAGRHSTNCLEMESPVTANAKRPQVIFSLKAEGRWVPQQDRRVAPPGFYTLSLPLCGSMKTCVLV